ncbi:TonB-dependent receptor [Gluconacetobacter azotocaptans]|uniref:TonB-dependent receptor n=1 Tax=Gluconacetobacter azotocaptans TaxID=142834 RepID=A0A7W4PFM6_9PROT|nr:TonB-dependent receptor [Gluconacetobacter azotocaptans]MBB2191850.1 TonB-dependent receptor [Gluconacetobacter azotocaptans]GBQ33310.1 TonB-dependent receptor [Gluconacetobacter azotocaptans DSM 13594]
MHFQYGAGLPRRLSSKEYLAGYLWQTTCCAALLVFAASEARGATARHQADRTKRSAPGAAQAPQSRKQATGQTSRRAPEGIGVRPEDVESVSVQGLSRNARRASELQKTPASASLLTAARLERLGVQNTRQLARLTPNLYVPNNMPGYAVTNYFIRGIGEIDPQGEPSVGTYIDGVYLPRNMGNMQELMDVADMEVDRGPVIFTGHQSEGGAVRINTIVPTNQRRFVAQTGYGTYNEYQIGVAASGALVRDKVYASLAFGRHARGGIDHNYTVGKDTNNIDYTQARGKLRFTPNERLDITLSFDGTVDGSTNKGVGNLLNPYIYGNYNRLYPKNNYSEVGFISNVRYTLSPHLSLFSISGIRGYDDRGVYDNTGDYYSRTSQPLYYKERMYSQELRLRGDYGRVNFNVGAYFLYEDWFTQRWANNAAGTGTNNPALIRTMPVYAVIDQLNRNWAVYGDASYHITPKLVFTAGLRFNWENHSNAETLSYLAPGPSHLAMPANNLQYILWGVPNDQAWQVSARQSWVQLLPKGSLSWQARSNLMAYVSISQGGKSAGYDFRAQTPTASGSQQAAIAYNPEIVTTYEIGVKTDPLPGRVHFNGALFWNQFDDIQLTTTDPTNGLSHRFNAGKGHSAGAEIETSAKLTRDLDLHYTASYLYAVLDTFEGTVSRTRLASGQIYNNSPYVGAPLAYAPRFQTMGSLTYRLPVHLPGTFYVGADVSFQSSLYTSSAANPQTRLSPQTYVNAMASWTSPDKRWSIQATARNLLDRRYLQSETFVQGGGVPIYESAQFADPRTIFVSAKFTL